MINLPNTDKVLVSYSGGTDSTLVLLLAIEQYGIDNVLAVYANIGRIIANNGTNEKHDNALKVFNYMVEQIGVNSVVVTPDEMIAGGIDVINYNNIHDMWNDISKLIQTKAGIPLEDSPVYLFGLAKKELDIIMLQRLNASVDGVVQNINIEDIEAAVVADPIKYSGVVNAYGIGNMHKHLPEFTSIVYSKFDEQIISMLLAGQAPIFNLTKADIMETYMERDWGEYLYKTITCSRPIDNINCGQCDLCNERKLSFANAGVPDQTVYVN